jgi:hypothetical protein
VRAAILEHIRQLRSGGLGDERAAAPAREATATLQSAHLEVLREIRAAIGRMAG